MKFNLPILYYHFIKAPGADATIKGLYTNAHHFEWQISKLSKKGYHFLTFKDIEIGNYDEKNKNIILTFDDGCESLYYNAFPILKKYNAKAVIYVVANSIGDRNVVWPDNENKEPLNLLTNHQISEMIAYGIEFGSHLSHHVHLPKLSKEKMRLELDESKLFLEKEFGIKVFSVAYPFGSYTNEVLTITKEAGYKYGVTTKIGDNKNANDFELFRIPIKGHALRHFLYFYKIMKRLDLK